MPEILLSIGSKLELLLRAFVFAKLPYTSPYTHAFVRVYIVYAYILPCIYYTCTCILQSIYMTEAPRVLHLSAFILICRRNIGVPVLAYNVKKVEVTACQFCDNHNLYPADINDGTNPFVGTKSSAGLSLFSTTTKTNILIKDCSFHNNTASQNHEDDMSQLLFKPHGRGSAILIRMIGTFNSSIHISKCTFNNNHAEVEGAAIYISLSRNASSNQILIRGNLFTKNKSILGAGGGIGLNSYQFSSSNRIYIENNVFAENTADSGGAVSFVLYDSNEISILQPDLLHFHNCSFKDNTAVHEGTAVGLFSLVHVDNVGFPVHFTDW